jgi:hypothetical protein
MSRESAIVDTEGRRSATGNEKLRKHSEDPKPKQWRQSEMNQTEFTMTDSEVRRQTIPTTQITWRSLRCSATAAAPISRLLHSNDGADQNRSSKIPRATTSRRIHVCKGGEGWRKTTLTFQFLCGLRGKKVPIYYKIYNLSAQGISTPLLPHRLQSRLQCRRNTAQDNFKTSYGTS